MCARSVLVLGLLSAQGLPERSVRGSLLVGSVTAHWGGGFLDRALGWNRMQPCSLICLSHGAFGSNPEGVDFGRPKVRPSPEESLFLRGFLDGLGLATCLLADQVSGVVEDDLALFGEACCPLFMCGFVLEAVW